MTLLERENEFEKIFVAVRDEASGLSVCDCTQLADNLTVVLEEWG